MEIRFDAAGVSFAGRVALSPLRLTLCERRIGVIGLNGSGKTTFAKLINGLVKPTSGHVTVDGLDTVSDADAVLGKVGFVFQNPQNQLIMPGVAEDLAFGLSGRGLSKAEIAARVEAMLASLGIADLAARRVHELSGGETQLVAMASVLVTGAEILILDEPTNQLDLKNRRQVVDAVAQLPQCVITVAHDLDLLADYDRVLVFDGGHLVQDGAPADSIARYREIAAC
ncbi:biotin transport system ATP-binding protein [Rhizobium sp. RU20A]|uniref:energy-coupling factor ABC transporter ATP-binding protein n=1 Tax=Rhizobium sp. RU20A TaxID=1907412 RepID=UPI0009550324|nr:ABC transporter ATP-binding protein [Rhizobium sp. RU20A]SIR09529.1 biotin transport system ATP-binding protein [Rhizobium sp. RU20A]